MKKRKGSLLQRMLAVLLAAVLVTGMVSNVAPASVLAQESGAQTVSGNDVELTEEETEPAGETNSEVQEPNAGTGKETPGTDAEEGGDMILKAQKTNGNAAQPVAGDITSDMTWADGSTVSDVTIKGGVSEQSPVVITVGGSVTVTGTITVSSGYVRFTGGGSLNWQSSNIDNAIVVQEGANTAFENVTLNGSNVNRFRRSALLFQGRVIFGNGTKVRNFASDTGSGAFAGYKGVIAVYGKGSLTITEGVTITGNCSTSGIITIYQSDTGGGESTASVTMSGGTIEGNFVNDSGLGVIWNWCGKLNISGGTVTAGGNEYAVHTQGNHGAYDATTVISGGTFTGNTLGAVCAGKDSTNNSRITIKGGTFTGATAATANYGEINIEGGSFKGSVYALQTLNAALNVAGGEFYGDAAAYEGNVTTTTEKVIVGTSKESAANWDKSTDLNTYKYVAIGELTEQPGDGGEHKHDGIVFTAWTETDHLPTDPGNYYLTDNVTLSGTWNVPSGETTLCLNGKTISASIEQSYRVITIAASSTLNLYDCQDAGNITKGRRGGVENSGTFHMYGGKISGNEITGVAGGGVSNTGSFYMYGGKISENIVTDETGGGVFNTSSGNFYMYGGEISENDANSVGGVFVHNGTFYMYGGKISGNNTYAGDNGISIRDGKFIVGGDAVISGNIRGGIENLNVCLKDGQTIELDSSIPLSGSANIGVTTETAPTEGNPVSITGHNKGDYSQYFHSDNPAYGIVNANDVVQLTVKTQSHTHNLTLTPAKSATCMEDGNTAYYSCNGCDKWFLDAAGTQEITDKDSVIIYKTGHSYDESAWGYRTAEGHAHNCRNCDAHDTVQSHTPGAAATESTPQTCTVCGYIIAPATGHTHNLTLTPAKFATCVEDGNTAYYTCDGCDKWFSDAAGTQEITDQDSVIISKTGHSYDESAWGYQTAEGHARKCRNCDAHDTVQSHTPGAAATESTPQTCTVCGYIIVPATGAEPGTGTVTPEVKPGVNAPATNISTPTEELKDMLLTEEEKQQVQNGTDIRIVLEVQDAGNTVSVSDRAAIAQALNGFTEGQYLNIDLYKLVGADRTDITETAKKIRIVIAVPDSLKNADSSKTRTFAVIRVHDGSAEVLADLDDSADTITIETDRFSTYAVAYKDNANGGAGDNDGNGDNGDNGGNDSGNTGDNGGDNGNSGDNSNSDNNNSDSGNSVNSNNSSNQNSIDSSDPKTAPAKDNEPKTGDAAPLELYATLAMIAGFAYLLLYFADRKRGMTEETKRELVSRLVGWARQGGKIRKCLALAAVFVLLVYYHSIGKKTSAQWQEIYGK